MKSKADLFVDRALRYAVDYVFDRVFAGDYLNRRIVAVIYRAVQGRGLARTCGPGDERYARRHAQHFFRVDSQDIRRKAQLLQPNQRGLVQDPEDDVLAKDCGIKGRSDIDLLFFSLYKNPAILVFAPFSNVGVGEDLDSRNNARSVFSGEIHFVDQDAVDSVTDAKLIGHWLEVNVRGALFNG